MSYLLGYTLEDSFVVNPEAMASANVREDLTCSICLDIYTDPVTLRCGHNFCRGCIDGVPDTEGGYGEYSCPQCRRTFHRRSPLQRNITLCNVVENFRSTWPHHEEITGICCTYCVDSPVPAVKSCLLCEASLCNNHLRVHSTGPEHILTDPTTSLGDWKCSVHKKILEYYCTEDAACICVSCSLAGEHRGHRVETLDEASGKKKEKLRNLLQKLITKKKKTEKRVKSLKEHKRKAQEKATGEAKRVTALFKDIKGRVDDLEKRILSDISRREKQESLPLFDVIQKLEIKKDELSGKIRHIEELCNMMDPLTVLQDPDTGDLCDPEEEGDEDIGGHDGAAVPVSGGILAGRENVDSYFSEIEQREDIYSLSTKSLEFKLFNLAEREVNLFWTNNSLKSYSDCGRVPRGLRVLKDLSQFKENAQFIKEWESILLKCSQDLLQLVLQQNMANYDTVNMELTKTKEEIKTRLSVNQWSLLEKKLDNKMVILQADIKQRKRDKFIRDKADFDTNQIFSWNKNKHAQNSRRFPRPRGNRYNRSRKYNARDYVTTDSDSSVNDEGSVSSIASTSDSIAQQAAPLGGERAEGAESTEFDNQRKRKTVSWKRTFQPTYRQPR
ncbi:uncharacterized protein LOC143773497 [Ranitomeya variabilis]|uniref:uncharacterized protein LOC143773497 n=1 Tax=Ranitomeya variabilis TaxID=490064 RepID=UPI0040565841